jgi:GxxExxY protein
MTTNNGHLTSSIIGAAIDVHRTLWPGLLESVYEECLVREFSLRRIPFERQKPVPLVYRDIKLECGYRLDFLVCSKVVVELKSIVAIATIHEAVMLTYLRLSCSPIGLLINFNVPVLKEGIRRFVWHYQEREDNAETLSTAEHRRGSRSYSGHTHVASNPSHAVSKENVPTAQKSDEWLRRR